MVIRIPEWIQFNTVYTYCNAWDSTLKINKEKEDGE